MYHPSHREYPPPPPPPPPPPGTSTLCSISYILAWSYAHLSTTGQTVLPVTFMGVPFTPPTNRFPTERACASPFPFTLYMTFQYAWFEQFFTIRALLHGKMFLFMVPQFWICTKLLWTLSALIRLLVRMQLWVFLQRWQGREIFRTNVTLQDIILLDIIRSVHSWFIFGALATDLWVRVLFRVLIFAFFGYKPICRSCNVHSFYHNPAFYQIKTASWFDFVSTIFGWCKCGVAHGLYCFKQFKPFILKPILFPVQTIKSCIPSVPGRMDWAYRIFISCYEILPIHERTAFSFDAGMVHPFTSPLKRLMTQRACGIRQFWNKLQM